MDIFPLAMDATDYAVLAIPTPQLRLPEGLTDAETSVAMLIVAGLSNAEIADARGCTIRTVANQVASLLVKSGAASRYELIALCRRREP
jgi:DNA-binding CsgD family transcriptional regulator